MLRLSLLMSAVLAAATPAAADVYRCVDPGGRFEYRDVPCDEGQSGEKIAVRPNVTSEIDQRAARAEGELVSERLAARARAEDEAAERARAGRPAQQPVEVAPATPAEAALPYSVAPYAYVPARPVHKPARRHDAGAPAVHRPREGSVIVDASKRRFSMR